MYGTVLVETFFGHFFFNIIVLISVSFVCIHVDILHSFYLILSIHHFLFGTIFVRLIVGLFICSLRSWSLLLRLVL